MTTHPRLAAPALIRPITATNQPAAAPSAATIVDITDRSLDLRVTPDVDVTPNRLIELGINGQWGRGRILWSRQGIRDAVIAAIELTDPDIVGCLRSAQARQAALAS